MTQSAHSIAESLSLKALPLACLLLAVLCVPACRDEAVGVGDSDASTVNDALPSLDSAVDGLCADWQPTPGELQVWGSASGVGARHASAAVGRAGTVMAVWATDDGVWGRVRCANGAPLREGGLDTRLDDGGAVSLKGPTVRALQDGRFVVTWRDDTDASIRAVWLDALGRPTGPEVQISIEETEAYFKPPTLVQLADGDLVFFWRGWYRCFSVEGEHRGTDSEHYQDIYKTLDAAPWSNGQLLQLREGNTSPNSAIVLSLRSFDYTPSGGIEYSDRDTVWPHLWNWGRHSFVLASDPSLGRAAVLFPGNYPYDMWLQRIGPDGLADGDAIVLGPGGDELDADAWMDLAMDGLGDTLAIWHMTDGSGEIHTWTEMDGDQILMVDWGDRPHFPRLAAYPDGGFLLLMTSDESHPDEDVLFRMIGTRVYY